MNEQSLRQWASTAAWGMIVGFTLFGCSSDDGQEPVQTNDALRSAGRGERHLGRRDHDAREQVRHRRHRGRFDHPGMSNGQAGAGSGAGDNPGIPGDSGSAGAGNGGSTTGAAGMGAGNPSEVCGDGIWGYFEQCDDGNTTSGDGCDATCLVEVGYNCDSGECHLAVCGDGLQEGFTGSDGNYAYEQCDDANATSGDGCTETCEVEAGWYCPQAGAPCRLPVCGDGLQDLIFVAGDPGGPLGAAGASSGSGGAMGAAGTASGGAASGGGYYNYEQCDDGNGVPGDGCSDSCEVEIGFLCNEPGTACRMPTCGDGFQDYYFVPGASGPSQGAAGASDPGAGMGWSYRCWWRRGHGRRGQF